MQKGALFKRNKIKFSIDPRRSPEAEEKKYTAHFLHGLFTRPSVKNPPIGCNKLVYERFEPERRPWYVSTNPLSPLSHRAPIGINMFPDREGGSWRKTRGALHKVRTINLDFEALICLAVPRGKRWLGDWDRWTASRGIISSGGYNARRYHPLLVSLPVPRGFILNSRLLTGLKRGAIIALRSLYIREGVVVFF